MKDILRLISVILLLVNFVRSSNVGKGSICAGKNATSEPVVRFCKEIGGTLVVRCCRIEGDKGPIFVAIDLRDANLTSIPPFYDTENFNLSVIDLRENSQLNYSSDHKDFIKLNYLNELLLPPQLDCPGGFRAWKHINKTSTLNGSYCRDQIDICTNSTGLCVEHAAICSGNGPNQFLCSCQSGYYGYKCLRNGKFPFAAFFGATISITIIASAVLYWTQRRHVKKSN